LVKAVDEKIAANDNLKAFVVVLTDDGDRTGDALKALAKDNGIRSVPLTLMETLSGPPAYKVAKDAEVTVLMWKGAEVKANHAFPAGQLDAAGIQSVLEDLPKILGK
jgi:hypothetical protein